MGLANILRNLLAHPLNRDHKSEALQRYIKWQLASRLLDLPVIVDFVNESRFVLSRGMSGISGNFYSGMHDFVEMSFLMHLLRPGDVFVDVGANVGSYTVLAGAAVGCRCHAIEPSQVSFEHLLDNIYINRITNNVIAHNVAAGAEEGVLQFSTSLGLTNHVIQGDQSNLSTTQISVKTVDGLVGTDVPTAMKIDVEGYETAVICGSQALLANSTLLALVIEFNDSGRRYGFDEGALHNLLTEEYGFRVVQYDGFSRVLREHGSNDHDRNNRIYARDLSAVQSRVESSPAFSLGEREI